jgi:hypothetical protein
MGHLMGSSFWIAVGLLYVLFGLAGLSWWAQLLTPFLFLAVIFVFSLPVLGEIAYRRKVPFWMVVRAAWTQDFLKKRRF